MRTFTYLLLLCLTLSAADLPPLIRYYKYVQTLVASADLDDKNYLMVPVLLRLGSPDVLLGYKRGYSHSNDREADFEILHLNPATQRVSPDKIDLHHPELNFQNGEFARFANGEIACYLDVQASGTPGKRPQAVRLGVLQYRSSDGGRTFHDAGKLGLVDGVEYGYVFDAITSGQTTWLLAMTFGNLPGGKNMPDSLPHHAGSVDVIRSVDNGKSWHLVKNLSHAFGNIAINESSFAQYKDGFLVATRGYDNRQWLNQTDRDFNLRKQVELNSIYPFIRSYIGRPRVFEQNGQFYLLGRNWTSPGSMRPYGNDQPSARSAKNNPMKLSLFRIDPETLAITKHTILDNADNENVVDGYYAMPYWQNRNGHPYLNIITYKRSFNRLPDIVRLEFDWDEVR
jgi:hypothetical protein